MTLQEFDEVIQRMQMALEYATNLGQYTEAAKVLYAMNDQLPDDLQSQLEDLKNSDVARFFISQYQPKIREAIVQYRQRLMNF